MAKFRSFYSDDLQTKKSEVKDGKSVTVKGMAMSVKQVINRCASGNPPSIANRAFFEEHPRFDDSVRVFEQMDLVDAKRVTDAIQAKIDQAEEEKAELRKSELTNLKGKLQLAQNRVTELEALETQQVAAAAAAKTEQAGETK